jgi:hypothetical protein
LWTILFSLSCPCLSVLSRLTYLLAIQAVLSGCHVHDVLYPLYTVYSRVMTQPRLHCTSCVLAVLFSFPVLAVISQLSPLTVLTLLLCHGYSVPDVISSLSSPSRPVLSVPPKTDLSRPTCQADLSRWTCPCCPVLDVLF